MKKIGLVSFFYGQNYGAILQSLALQRKIANMGYQATYINYLPPSTIKGIKKLKNIIYSYVRWFLGYKQRKQRTDLFIGKFQVSTPKMTACEEVRSISSEFDLFVAGSDQIWHPRWMTVSKYFLLNFVEDKPKVSYASSFGVKDIPEKHQKIYRDELKKFEFISVREESGLQILNKMGIKNGVVVLDPTLLLSKEAWMQFFDTSPIVKAKYIFCYVMPGDHKTSKHIANLAKKLNELQGGKYAVIVVGDKEHKRLIPGYNLICDAGPAEFLNFMFNASYIITSSFHGTCFALNFNKQLIPVLDRNNLYNSRIIDFMSRLDLENTLCYTDQNINDFSVVGVDYDKVNNSLEHLRKESVSFLENSFAKILRGT